MSYTGKYYSGMAEYLCDVCRSTFWCDPATEEGLERRMQGGSMILVPHCPTCDNTMEWRFLKRLREWWRGWLHGDPAVTLLVVLFFLCIAVFLLASALTLWNAA